MKTPRLTLLALAACALLAAGCGGDDEPDEQSDAPATTESAPADEPVETNTATATIEEDEEAAPDTSDPYGPGAAGDADATREQAIEACKNAITGVSDDIRRDLERICDQGAGGNADAVREQAVEVCRKIVADQVPQGNAREQALAACERAAP